VDDAVRAGNRVSADDARDVSRTGHEIMPVMRILADLRVSDIDAAKHFYTDYLGPGSPQSRSR
jgi:catechol-2,3-dioxygenase